MEESFPFGQSSFMNMENGVIGSNNTGFCVSDKASTLLPLQNRHVGLGLNLQSTQTFPPGMKGRGHHHYYHDHPDDDDHHRPLSSSGGLKGRVGPTPNSGPTEAVGCGSTPGPTHIYTDGDDVVIATSSSGGAAVTALQSFDISTPATSTALKSPGGGDMSAAALGFPFTSAQWKELERQAMIYKYMMASVPVPHDLLLPIIQSASAIVPTASHSSLGNGSLFNLSLRFSSNNKDPEPGRCKRTDGKKWRCSRDAAPQQKYCERHMHRGRPRSRKPVEVQPPFNSTMNKKSRLHHHPLPPTPTTTLLNSKAHTTISSPQLLRSTFQLNETPSSDGNISASSYEENSRSLDCAMEDEMLTIDGSEQQWQHFLQKNVGLTTNASVFQRACIEEPRNRIAYTDFGALEADQQNDDCTLFLNPDLVCIEKQPKVETPRGFIDAWSNDPKTNVNIENENNSFVCSHGNLSFSDLTLSMAMAAGNAIDEGMGQIPVGVGIGDSNDFKPQVWLGPGPWLGSNPGGPLAEVLRPTSSTAVSSDPTSPHGGNGDSTSSTPATRASSPSGVLQRAMLSLSDSSGCNSPTIAASTATPEMKAFQWLS